MYTEYVRVQNRGNLRLPAKARETLGDIEYQIEAVTSGQTTD